MKADLILRGARLVTGRSVFKGDLAVQGERIAAIGDLSAWTAAEEMDCQGLHLLPGVIDTQVHFREPGLEHKEDLESGTRAAVMGGVTSVFEMPNTDPPTTTAERLQDKVNRAKDRTWCDTSFFVGASPENVDQLARLEMLPGTPGIKIFMGSSTGSLLVESDDLLLEVLRNGSRPCPVHSEDEARNRERKSLISEKPHAREHPYLRDAESARLCTERLLRLASEARRPVHVLHISTKDELPLLAGAKAAGMPVTCEITPQHLSLNADLYESMGSLLQMNPPIRSEEHRAALFEAFQAGLFDIIGSDHAPHTLEEKSKPYPKSPSGMPGVQTLLPVMLDWVNKGALDISALVRMTSENPARIYGLRDKGFLSPGGHADLVLVDMDAEWEVTPDWLQSKCGWSPYTGSHLKGRVEHVLLRGSYAVRDRALVGEPRGKSVRFTWKASH